jgi:hypothetical protein
MDVVLTRPNTKRPQLPRFVSQDHGSGSTFSRVPLCDVILEGREQIIHARR